MTNPNDQVRIDRGGWISGPMLDVPEMSPEEASYLFELARIWGSRYKISLADGVWQAARLGNSLITFTAGSGPELRGLIAEDHVIWEREARKHNTVPTEGPGCSI